MTLEKLAYSTFYFLNILDFLMNTTDSFVQFLVEAGALKFGDFVTKSGRKTPYFINTGEFRTGKTLSKLAEFYASAFMQHFDGKAENLYGPAYKGIPLCAATSMKLSDMFNKNLSFTYNRKEAKDKYDKTKDSKDEEKLEKENTKSYKNTKLRDRWDILKLHFMACSHLLSATLYSAL